MLRFISLMAIALTLASCSSQQQLLPDSEKAVIVDKAEAYLIRHGFTSEPHPDHLPVENIDVLDQTLDQEIILERRFNTVQKVPYCIGAIDDGYIVAFNKTVPDSADCPTVIKIDTRDGVTLYHDCVKRSYLNNCKRIEESKK